MSSPALTVLLHILFSSVVSSSASSDTHDDVIDFIGSLASLQKTVAEQALELEYTKKTLNYALEELQATKDELFSVKNELRYTSGEVITSREAVKELEDKCQNMTDELKVKLDKAEVTAVTTQTKLDEFKDKYHNTTAELKVQIHKGESEVITTRAECQNMTDELNIKINKTEAKLTDTALSVDAVENKYHNVTNALTFKLDQTEAEVQQTTSSLSKLQSEVNSTQAEITTLTADRQLNTKDLQQLSQELHRLDRQFKTENIGFLMSSNFGDNGYNHNGLVYVVNNRSNLVFPDTTLNHGNSYHVNNGTMTAPVTGIYLIWVNVNMATPHFTVSLKKTPTGEVIKEGLSHQKNVEFMTPVYLVQGEGVVVQIQGEALVYPDTPLSEFGGVLIRKFEVNTSHKGNH